MQNYRDYWVEVLKMWWHDNFKSWVLTVMSVFGIIVLLSVHFSSKFSDWLTQYAFEVLIIAIVIALIPMFVYIPSKLWNIDKKLRELAKEQNKTPKNYVFPFVRNINANPIKNGEDYVIVTINFPSALIDEIELAITGTVTIEGCESKLLETKRVILSNQSNQALVSYSNWNVYLNKQAISKIKGILDNPPSQGANVSANLRAENNSLYSWNLGIVTMPLQS
jgi:hypothetical protein